MADGASFARGAGCAAAVLALGLLRAALDAAGARSSFRRARRHLGELRAQALSALSGSSPLDPGRPAAGEAASVLAEQADAALPYLSRYPAVQLKVSIVPLAIVAAVLPLSWVAALVLLVAAPLIPVFMALVGWRAQRASQEHLAEMGGMNAFLLDRLRGLATLRALDAVQATARRIDDVAQNLRTRTMAVLRIAFLSSAVLELFSAIGVAMVAVYVGFHLLGQVPVGTWGTPLSLGQGLFILLLAPAFFEPLRELSAVWHDRASGQAALQALAALRAPALCLPGTHARPASGATVHAAAPAIAMHAVDFRYGPEHAEALRRFDLAVAPGEHVAIVGPSGAGKSTVLALIAGLAPAQGGRICIGGTELTDDTAATLRTRMAWIGQRAHVFAGTLRANVALGRGMSPAAIDAALRAATLDHLADDPAGRSLGESGTGLAGGEILRLALARAAASPDCDVWLADEPTAHLDAATARELTRRLLALAAGKTLVVATHDPELAACMDRVVPIGAGVEACAQERCV
ncbi:ATP-binding/permease protein CydD [Pigmentiphaga humi]|uniref:ATP-binding/permease protein CydD n=2 Tax=Pigmentiphaga humi TaxID=2478468 RepID=A0A3P4B3Y1_9BURK|nr:ATP-binding/permease protein CydD [Pigmentiphaga humi]